MCCIKRIEHIQYILNKLIARDHRNTTILKYMYTYDVGNFAYAKNNSQSCYFDLTKSKRGSLKAVNKQL